MKMKNNMRATPAAADATPPKPNTPAQGNCSKDERPIENVLTLDGQLAGTRLPAR
jgi:hypothetical protein